MTPQERAVINAAIEWRRAIPGRRTALTVDLEALIWQLIVSCAACNYERHICPGCGANIGHGETACAACSDGPREDPVLMVWHPRPLRDVRKGDVIRPAGTDAQSTVTDRYWPPQPATRNPDGGDGLPKDRGTWHVIGDPGLDKWAYTRDHVVQPGEVVICLDGGEPRNMAPDFAVEILLDPAEIAAIDAIGWDNRIRTS